MRTTKKDPENYVGYKVRLFPTKEQEHLFYEYFGLNRFVYNLGINLQEEHKKSNNDKLLSKDKLNNLVNKIKYTKELSWITKYSAETTKLTLYDLMNAYWYHEKRPNHYNKPKRKSKEKSNKQFPIRAERMNIYNSFIYVPSIGNINYYNSYGNEILGTGYNKMKNKNLKYIHYCNPRISFDGINYYLSFTIPKDQSHQVNSYWKYSNNEEWQEQEESKAIGIDVGLKNEKWLVDSTGTKVERPNSDTINKKINRLERQYDRQKNTNLKKNSSFMEQHPNGSKNMQKTRTKINKCYKKITNRRRNVVHEYACSLLKKKPKAVVMETISSTELMDKHKYNKNIINKMIYDAALNDTMTIIEKKMNNNGIPVIKADSNYPSSQICSCCGNRHNIGRAKYYRCPDCGAIIDRDLNAAINLSKLAY